MTVTAPDAPTCTVSAPVIEAIGPDIWVADGGTVTFMSLRLGTRMTIIRLADGTLWLHSPVERTPTLATAVSAIGPVSAIVAPNKLHHLFLADWIEAYPEARVYGGPGLAEKRRDLKFDEVLGDAPPSAWADEIDQLVFPAAPAFDEVVFFHRTSGIAILTDLIVNERLEHQSLLGRVWGRIEGVGWPHGTTPILVRLGLRDRQAARHAVERMLAWQPQAAVISHGEWFRQEATKELRQRLAWLQPN